MLQRHHDRVSVSFADDKDDHDVIVTVTFDLRAVIGLDDAAVIEKAVEVLKEPGSILTLPI